MTWWESWRTASAAGDGPPWYDPEIGRHFTDLRNGGNQAVRRHVDETQDRVDAARMASNAALGVRGGTRSGNGAGGGRIETGHHVMVNLDYPSHTWYAAVSPPSYPRTAVPNASAFLHLGTDDEQVPHMLIRRLMHPQTQEYLRQTMDK